MAASCLQVSRALLFSPCPLVKCPSVMPGRRKQMQLNVIAAAQDSRTDRDGCLSSSAIEWLTRTTMGPSTICCAATLQAAAESSNPVEDVQDETVLGDYMCDTKNDWLSTNFIDLRCRSFGLIAEEAHNALQHHFFTQAGNHQHQCCAPTGPDTFLCGTDNAVAASVSPASVYAASAGQFYGTSH
eukprot:TRINITY_DN573_c0_g1_i1.p1 TRINITY_DN573_c0_g1~~TRINITY_DN573_c0_g1_i1.p1  ORF type:complete len:185 (+),score=21.80 TRINITY_DN573_c0_g1_i1:129-683(+)